jgi:hypothetical protein
MWVACGYNCTVMTLQTKAARIRHGRPPDVCGAGYGISESADAQYLTPTQHRLSPDREREADAEEEWASLPHEKDVPVLGFDPADFAARLGFGDVF